MSVNTAPTKRPPIHIIDNVLRNKKEIRQSVPADLYETIQNNKKIVYRGENLKTSKIASFCDMLYKKHDQGKGECVHNLNAEILQKRYGCKYKFIINYLIKEGYIARHTGYKPKEKSTSYRMLKKMFYKVPKHYYNEDKVTIKNYKVNVLSGILNRKELSADILKGLKFNDKDNIPKYIRKDIGSKMINDLYTVDIDLKQAMKYVNEIKEELPRYYNELRILDIADKHIWYQFDNYGRFHSNFTVVKKLIRANCLTINGEEIDELDISNSQPLLLAKIIRDSGEPGDLVDEAEFETFSELVKEGKLYDHLRQVHKYKDKKDVKKNLVYKVLFGDNSNMRDKANRNFHTSFPTIYEFIKRYKAKRNNYKALSHALQRVESELIFNKIIKEIMLTDVSISLFTVHDSICFPKSSKYIVEEIFNKHVDALIDSI
jgi:hypothetical protein